MRSILKITLWPKVGFKSVLVAWSGIMELAVTRKKNLWQIGVDIDVLPFQDDEFYRVRIQHE